jgi:hypothetical protein
MSMAHQITRYLRTGALVGVLATLLPAAMLATASEQAGSQLSAEEDLGDTYYNLEGKAGRVTTRFDDGSVAIAQRDADGSIRTQLSNTDGTEIASLHVRGDKALLRKAGRLPLETPINRRRRTLDWANVEVTAQVRGRASEPRSIEAEFEGGFVARTETKDRIYTVIYRYGTEVGRLQYLPKEQVLAWKFPGVTTGWVDPTRLKKVGGWKFKRTMAWATVQALAFYEFHTKKQQTPLPPGVALDQRGWLQRALDAVVTPVYANDAGCDRLHWLDSSIFRPCCDDHDRCYSANGCNQTSWWWWGSWSCNNCNMNVITCFASGGDYQPFYPSA